MTAMCRQPEWRRELGLQRDGISRPGADKRSARRCGEAAVRDVIQEGQNAPEEEQAELSEALEEAAHDLDKARRSLMSPPTRNLLMDVWFANAEQGWRPAPTVRCCERKNGGRQWNDWSHKVDNP